MIHNIAQLRNRLAAEVGFSAVEQVDDLIIRANRKFGDVPFAVYYFDFTQVLPGNQEMLTEYQYRVIGSRYFDGIKSLQWNNYLYFVISKDRLASGELCQTKELIERDRKYARKFVISAEELDSVIKPPVVAPSDKVPHASILSIWTDCLVKAGLDNAILSDDDLPTRLKLIEASSNESAAKPMATRLNEDVMPATFINSLQLKTFRRCPMQQNFDFGTANLIFGANGSGKTSLLEAIELFYCGLNKRNHDVSLPYKLIVRLADDRTETATDSRKPQLFRDRNLSWYGQAEVKTNGIYQSFAQFNFLDTDAAVRLAESAPRIEDALSKLLVGPDASKTWHDIEWVDKAVTEKLRDLRLLESQIVNEISENYNRLKEASGVKQESDSIYVRLEKMILFVGWSALQGDKDVFASHIVESLSELEALAQQATLLDWTESPVSIDGLTKYCREAKITSEKAEADIVRLEFLRRNEKLFADVGKRGQEALNLAAQVKRFIEAGLPVCTEELGKQKDAVATYSGWLVGCDDNTISMLSRGEQDSVLANYYEDAVLRRSAADALLTRTKSELAHYSKIRDQSLNLAQQLRETADRILQTSPKPDECPLCHTQFTTGELVKHINKGVDEYLEAPGRTLLAQLRNQERAMRDATAVETVSGCLRKFCERASLAADISVRSALVELENAKRILQKVLGRQETLNKELLVLELQGISTTTWEEILDQLRELGYPLTEFSQAAVDRLIMVINQDLANSSRSLETAKKQADALRQTLEATLGLVKSGVPSLMRALSQLKERWATTESFRSKFLNFSSSLPWPGNSPLALLAVEAVAIRKVAAEFQAALGREKLAKTIYSKSSKKKEELEGQLRKLQQRIKRLTKAQTTFKIIRNKHSLARALNTALKQNHVAIEKIFARIHSPMDFCGLGSKLTILVRRWDNEEAMLSQISTGQRAAFALAIFLAQNAQLNIAAPPVILIDDPIAHVDDLNALSFLDYLREVVLTGKRQLFYATANEKLATLFERKFDFLGNRREFRRFNLRREA